MIVLLVLLAAIAPAALAAISPAALAAPPAPLAAPPATQVAGVADTLHGVVITDPYRWLEDQDSPATREWLAREIAYTESFFPRFTAQKAVETRYSELERVDRARTPIVQGGRCFYARRRADQELWTTWWRQGRDGEEKLLIDPHGLSADLRTSASLTDVAHDGRLVAYSIRQGGQDEEEVHFRDVDTGADLPDILPVNVYFGVSITPDHQGCFYTALTDDRTGRVRYHRFGTPLASDRTIFGEGYGPEDIVSSALSEDGRWLEIAVYLEGGSTKNELFIMDALGGGPVIPVVTGREALFYGTVIGDRIYIQTNDQAPNWKVMLADIADPAPEHWHEVIPEAQAPIEWLSLGGGRLFVSYLENVHSRVEILDPSGEPQGELPLPGIGSCGYASGQWDGAEVYYSFTSYTVPGSIYCYNIAAGTRATWFRPQVPFRSDDFEVEQVWYTSRDGTQVPMFLAHRKGLARDGNQPVYLTGYGGFSISSGPYFSTSHAIWMEAGGLLAEPALRGGGEFGEAWHRAGMLEHKQNVFDDFIAAAQWLFDQGYTRPEHLAISGGSNGGLLVGAVLTQRPELCKAVVCWHPLLDMLRYHRTMMGPYWTSEYGSADDPEQFPFLYAYSPYHHVRRGVKYPAVLFISGDGDTRVDPMHARKMTALLQAAVGEAAPVLLHYDLKSGHVGGDPVSKSAADAGVELGFLMWQLGMTYERPAGLPAEPAASGPASGPASAPTNR